MKKVLLLLSVSILIFSSCKKDEDEPIKGNELLGKWKVFSIESNQYQSLDECMSKSWVLFENTTVTSKDYEKVGGDCMSSQNTFNYTVEGSQLKYKVDGEEIILIYSISGNKLTLDGGNGTIVYTKM